MSNIIPFPGKGGPSQTKFYAIVANGPMFLAQLTAIEVKVAQVVARTGVKAAAEVIMDEWKQRVPVLDEHYRDSLKIRTRSRTRSGQDVNGAPAKALSGATATIYPGPVKGVEQDEQPALYAGVLEYGGHLTAAQHNSYIPAQPSARPAFDVAAPRALDAFERHLTVALLLP